MRFTEPRTLESFVEWFLSQPFKNFCFLESYEFGSVRSTIVYRDPPFQAELFQLVPNTGFPRDHRHPDVDTYEYGMSDYCPLIVNGQAVDGAFGALCKVGAEDWHRVGDIPHGGTFLSLQEWKNGVAPTSVGLNWCGVPVSFDHRKLLRRPDAKWVKGPARNKAIEMCKAKFDGRRSFDRLPQHL